MYQRNKATPRASFLNPQELNNTFYAKALPLIVISWLSDNRLARKNSAKPNGDGRSVVAEKKHTSYTCKHSVLFQNFWTSQAPTPNNETGSFFLEFFSEGTHYLHIFPVPGHDLSQDLASI